MGRWYCDAKTTVEDATQLNIFKLNEFGFLSGHKSGTLRWTRSLSGKNSSIGIIVNTESLCVEVSYTIRNPTDVEKTEYNYKIPLTTTPCYFGGVRYWFLCPLSINGIYCGRRVATLYLTSGGLYFGCRHCYGLSYESRNESRIGRPGEFGYCLKLDRLIDEAYAKAKRRTWRGRPTRKMRRIAELERRFRELEK